MTESLRGIDIVEAFSLLTLMIVVGILAGTRKEEGFLIGNRSITAWKLAGTVSAGVIGGGVLLVFSEYAFRYGLSAFFIIGGIVVGTLLMIPVATRFKPLADRQMFYSVPDLYTYEWGRVSGLLATVIVTIWTACFIVMQLISAGEVLEFMIGWPYWIGVVLSAATVASYLLASGFEAVVITDILQYIALIVLLIVVFPTAISQIDIHKALEVTTQHHMAWGEAIGFFVLGALNMVVGADMWQRFYAARTVNEAKRGLRYSALLVAIAGLLLLVPAFYARTALTNIVPNQALTQSLKLLLPRWLLGFGLVGVLSTIIATLDTMVFILGISMGHDMFVQQLSKPVSNRVRGTRLAIILALVLGCTLSILFRSLLAAGLALSTLGLVLSPSIVLRLFKDRVSPRAVDFGLALGLLGAAGLVIGEIFKPGVLSPENALIALGMAIIGTGIGSLPIFARIA